MKGLVRPLRVLYKALRIFYFQCVALCLKGRTHLEQASQRTLVLIGLQQGAQSPRLRRYNAL